MLRSLRRALAGAAVATAMGTSVLAAQGAAAPAPAGPSLTIGGLVYAQYVYQLDDTANHQNNFDITRGYVNLLGKFPHGLATRVTVDLFTVSNPAAGNNEQGSYGYRLKYAFVAWTPNPNSPLTYKFGMLTTPWLDWEEALWDFRMQGTMPMERAGYVTSSDIGVGIDGNVNHEQLDFQATLVNGEGYHGGFGDQRKDGMIRASLRLLPTNDASRVGGLRVTAYGQYGKPTGGGARSRVIGMVSYRSKTAELAGEVASTRDSTDAPATKPVNGHVYAAHGWYELPKSGVRIMARVDVVKPQSGVPNNQTTRYIGGLSYQVTPTWRVLVDVDHLSYQTTPTPAQKAVQTQAYFQTQFTF